MQQVSLTTTKNLEEAEQIAKNLGMEIILKTDSAWMEFEDLSPNELLAWYDASSAHMKLILEDAAKNDEIMQKARIRSTRYVNHMLEIIKTCRENPSLSLRDALDSLNRERRIELSNWKGIRDSARTLSVYDFELMWDSARVHASVLVAKKGDNVMRYLNFQDYNDPIVTIMGSNAELLASCKNHF